MSSRLTWSGDRTARHTKPPPPPTQGRAGPDRATMTSTARIRAMQVDDLSYVVAEHQRSLPDGVYPRLGDRFLHAYHSAYLTSAGTVALVSELNGRSVGFITGVVSGAAHQSAMRQAWPRLAVSGTLALLQRPAMIAQVLPLQAAVGYLRRSARLLRAGPTNNMTGVRTGILTYLAVTPSARGHGVGDALLDAFLCRAQAAGCEKVTLATQQGPKGAEQFYSSRGWTNQGLHHTPKGRPLLVMAWTWPSPPPDKTASSRAPEGEKASERLRTPAPPSASSA